MSKVKVKVHPNTKCHVTITIKMVTVNQEVQSPKNIQTVIRIMYLVIEKTMIENHRKEKVNKKKILSKLEISPSLKMRQENVLVMSKRILE